MDQHNYHISDYAGGYAHPKDNPRRVEKIGKVLEKTKAPDIVKKTFQEDPSRKSLGGNGEDYNGDEQDRNEKRKELAKKPHQITYSRNPYDVASSSTGKSWISCMDMDTGRFKKHLPKDIEKGSHIAYQHGEDDPTMSNPSARILLKPHKSRDGHTILHPENKIYGNPLPGFKQQVSDWTNKHFPKKPDTIYTKDKDLYDDDDSPHQIDVHDINNTINNEPDTNKVVDTLTDKKGEIKHSQIPNEINHKKIKAKLSKLVDNERGRKLLAHAGNAETIHHLAMQDDEKHARTAAQSPKLTEKDAHVLSDHPSLSVARELMEHSKHPGILEHIAKNHPNKTARQEAENNIKNRQLFEDNKHHFPKWLGGTAPARYGNE